MGNTLPYVTQKQPVSAAGQNNIIRNVNALYNSDSINSAGGIIAIEKAKQFYKSENQDNNIIAVGIKDTAESSDLDVGDLIIITDMAGYNDEEKINDEVKSFLVKRPLAATGTPPLSDPPGGNPRYGILLSPLNEESKTASVLLQGIGVALFNDSTLNIAELDEASVLRYDHESITPWILKRDFGLGLADVLWTNADTETTRYAVVRFPSTATDGTIGNVFQITAGEVEGQITVSSRNLDDTLVGDEFKIGVL